jgi:hypothetical protein
MEAFNPKSRQTCRRPWLRFAAMGLRLFLKVSIEALRNRLTDTAATLSSDNTPEIVIATPFFRRIRGSS